MKGRIKTVNRNRMKFKLQTMKLIVQPRKKDPVGVMATNGKHSNDQNRILLMKT